MNWSRLLIHGSNESNITKTSNFEGGCTIIIGILNNIAEGTRTAYCEAKYSLQKNYDIYKNQFNERQQRSGGQ